MLVPYYSVFYNPDVEEESSYDPQRLKYSYGRMSAWSEIHHPLQWNYICDLFGGSVYKTIILNARTLHLGIL